MEDIQNELETLKVDVTEKVLVIDEVEYMCKSSNKTKLEVKKDFINDAIEKATLKEIIVAGIHIAKEVAQEEDIFVAASIGPIPEMTDNIHVDQEKMIEYYKFIVDIY